MTPSPAMLDLKRTILSDGQKRAEDQIEAYNTGNIITVYTYYIILYLRAYCVLYNIYAYMHVFNILMLCSLYSYTGNIRLKPGCDALQSLESEVNGVLGQIREQIGILYNIICYSTIFLTYY